MQTRGTNTHNLTVLIRYDGQAAHRYFGNDIHNLYTIQITHLRNLLSFFFLLTIQHVSNFCKGLNKKLKYIIHLALTSVDRKDICAYN